MKARVYVAKPYTQGDVALNVRRAYEAANHLADLGFAPFVPHATHFWHMLFPRTYEFWLKTDAATRTFAWMHQVAYLDAPTPEDIRSMLAEAQADPKEQ